MARARKAQNVIGIMLPGNSMTVGTKHVHDQAIRQNIDGSFLLASELSNAKDIPVMLVIQRLVTQRQMAAYSTQTQVLGSLMAAQFKAITHSDGTTVWAECPLSRSDRGLPQPR